jgi:GTP-binding protein EngB required for normal cell division
MLLKVYWCCVMQLGDLLLCRQDPSRRLMVGLVGYPNVGKSSTINAIFGSKKTAVAPTPGKTKHFQTLNVSPTICLCDCPGGPLGIAAVLLKVCSLHVGVPLNQWLCQQHRARPHVVISKKLVCLLALSIQ